MCFDCNQKGHIKDNPECPKEQDRRRLERQPQRNKSQSCQNLSGQTTTFRKIAPKQEQPEEKTVKGVKYKWYGVCGFWSKTHGTSEHQAKGKITMAKTLVKPPDWEPKVKESKTSPNDAVQVYNDVQTNQTPQGAEDDDDNIEPVCKLSLFGMFAASSIKSKNYNDWMSPKVSDDDDGEFMLEHLILCCLKMMSVRKMIKSLKIMSH